MEHPRTKQEWFTLAETTLPKLVAYAYEFNIPWNNQEANREFIAGNGHALASRLETLWQRLPDSPTIRHAPFFALCDLCSERHLVE